MTVRHLDEAPLTIAGEPCDAEYLWDCGSSFSALGNGAFLVGWSSPSIAYLERHTPGEAPYRVSQPVGDPIAGILRAPEDTVLLMSYGAVMLKLVDAITLATVGEGEFLPDGLAARDGVIPTPSSVSRMSGVSASGSFVALVDGLVEGAFEGRRWSLGHVCPPEQ